MVWQDTDKMASIRRTDIMYKKYSKGRPAKSERERIFKRQEAYKWRDARRVYLAGSFDRWRKLRSSLKLKDSSLAWHLMEAHEKGHCTFCRHCNFKSKERDKQKRRCDQKEFLPSLIASIRQLCHAHFDFNDCIEIVGLLCLEFDKARKENFSINECIRSGMKSDSPFHVSTSSVEPSNYSLQESSSSLSLSHPHYQEVSKLKVSDQEPQVAPVSSPCSTASLGTELSVNVGLSERLKTGDQNFDVLCAASSRPSMLLENVSGIPCTFAASPSKNKINISSDSADKRNNPTVQTYSSCDTEEPGEICIHLLDKEEKLMDSSLCSESEPSLEIDIEKMDTSQEEDNTIILLQEMKHHSSSPNPKSHISHESTSETIPLVNNDLENLHNLEKVVSQCNKDSILSSAKLKLEIEDRVDKPENIDLPLDMSVLKSKVKKEVDVSMTTHSIHDYNSGTASPNYKGSESVQFSPSASKRKISEANSISSQSSRRSPFWLERFQSLPGKMKEEGHTSIPWQRRDMSRKEEYEFLEMNPFSDLADFSQRYPHVHQRTYYRWKRRIKEEYIILEQCPGMSFQEFSSAVLQAKESVFCHWKSLIAQGKGFFAPSDTSKRLETKCPLKPISPHNSAYAFVQKNLTSTYEQFFQQYPGTPVDVFHVLKRKAMQEFWLFHQNQHMSHKDFSKLVNVNEDVFNAWKKYVECFRSNAVSPNLKQASNNLSPNPHMSLSSFHSLDGSQSSTADLQVRSSKDGHFRMKDSSSAFKESKATVHSSALNAQLTDSVARSLSNSYLASLQNMMFPWHSYYGMTSPIGQQMLPMMMWPGMIGLPGGVTNSLGLMSGTHVDDVAKHSVLSGLHNTLQGTASESTESLKSDESQSNHSDEHMHISKRLGSSDSREQFKQQVSSDGEKRLKMSNDKDDVDFLGSVNRSRKQNKQEYIYYLKNPELCFKELESLFPSISLRTFYRWRKEMNAAVLLLEGNKDMTFNQFQMVFPDIPEDIFELWKERSGSGMSCTLERQSQQSIEPEELNWSDQNLSTNDKKSNDICYPMESSILDLMDSHLKHNPVTSGSHSDGGEDGIRLKKNVKESYLFVQKNPNIDFASFSRLYPDASVRSFYRWKKELKDAISFLRANPTMVYGAYKSVDSTVSEEVFNIWKSIALDSQVFKEEISDDSISTEETESSTSNHLSRKLTGPEYWHLQFNPYIEFSQFNRTYPDVPKRTFYRWKQEIQQIINYIQAEPSVEFADIASVLPQVSEDAFTKWKQIIIAKSEGLAAKNYEGDLGTRDVKDTMHRSEVDDHTKNRMTEALLYLMHNPTVKYSHFKVQFDFVSVETFQLWLKRIKTVILYIASHPSIDYTTFSTSIKDVAEGIFEIWKNLGSEEIATLGLSCEETITDGAALEPKHISDGLNAFLSKNDLLLEAFEFCQKNPDVIFTVLQTTYPAVTEELFFHWMSNIQKELHYIRENPDLQFDDFSKVYPHTKQDVFDLWTSDGRTGRIEHFLQMPLDETMQEDIIPSENCTEGNVKTHIIISKSENPELRDTKDQKEGNDTIRMSCTEDLIRDHEAAVSMNESHDNEPMESSLTKLTKFADSGDNVDPKKYLTGKLSSSVTDLLKNNNNKALKLEPLFSSSESDNYLADPNAVVSAHAKKSNASEIEIGNLYSASPVTAALHTSSLSALMAMTSDDPHKGNQASSPKRERSGHNVSPLCSGSPNWQRTSNGSVAFGSNGAIKDDDEAFSSQRQKKMSRAEYLFVKDNPDVDSQEFSRIFPGVSARTFYRWKKEIKAQLNLV